MKKTSISVVFIIILIINFACNTKKVDDITQQEYAHITKVKVDTTDFTNDFYDNAETYNLKTNTLRIEGEITNSGEVDFSTLPLHSVVVKETLLDNKGGDTFIGAFRYDGYSLYDILNLRHLNKKNSETFKPIIDLFIEIENDKGEKVVISWGEIYYPNHLNEIIIATKVTRIVPSKTNELWELPIQSKLVVSHDLITERNINNPVKITIKSYDKKFKVEKGKYPLFSSKIDIYVENEKIETLLEKPKDIAEQTLHTIFYGRGRGIHSTKPFTGISIKDYFKEKIQKNQNSIRKGIFVFVADDGYRGVFTYSEICNRNDQAEVLLICRPNVKTNGIFRLFPSCDFFSDRAIKAINSIYYSENQK